MNWKYALILSFLIFAMTQAVSFASGISFATSWSMYGASMEEAAANSTLVRRAVIAVIAFPMYLVFFRRITTKRLIHLVVVLIGTGLFNLLFEAPMGSRAGMPSQLALPRTSGGG
jgi:hypothetical protein